MTYKQLFLLIKKKIRMVFMIKKELWHISIKGYFY